MTTFVEVPAEDIENFLQSKDFTRTVTFNEVVYERPHDLNTQVKIKVYTSICVGGKTRKNGADSIKVCTVLDTPHKSYGLGKFPRVHRTGSTEAVLSRTLERMRDAYVRGTEWIRKNNAKEAKRQEAKSSGGYHKINNPAQFKSPLDTI